MARAKRKKRKIIGHQKGSSHNQSISIDSKQRRFGACSRTKQTMKYIPRFLTFWKIEREIEKEVEDAEKWVIERRKFFIKLGYIVIFVLILLFLASFL